MQLQKISLISPKGNFWTTSQENSKASRETNEIKTRGKWTSLNQSIDPLAIREANKPTMKNAISCKQNEIILTCHVEITRDVPCYIAKKVYGGRKTQKRANGGR